MEDKVKIEISDNPMFNRLAATGKQVNTITLCRDGMDANYYNVVEVANIVKEIYNPKISSLVLLKQLIHMVCNKEMEPFHLIVIDMDSKEYKGYVDKHGVIHEVYVGSMSNSKIMQEYRKYSGFIYAYSELYNTLVSTSTSEYTEEEIEDARREYIQKDKDKYIERYLSRLIKS